MTIPISLLALHFIGDFLLQSNWMATNKSKKIGPLLLHCLVYAACFLPYGAGFVWITFWLHLITDAITSRITTYLWQKERRHAFFVTIGADQLIHYATLAWTLNMIG